MKRSRSHNPAVIALWANAGLLAALLIAMLSRGGVPGILPAAYAVDEQSKIPLSPQPIAGGAGLFLMPAQFAINRWGCYVMDVDRRTLCAYLFTPEHNTLQLVAARGFTYDLQLKDFNTHDGNGGMSPNEVRQLVEKEKQDALVRESPAAPPAAETPPKPE